MKKRLFTGFSLLAGAALMAAETTPEAEVMEAYADLLYPVVRKTAEKHPDLPEAQLTRALTAVFDRRKMDLAFGLPELKRIAGDPSFAPALRLQAKLSYARAAQALQMRPGVFPAAEKIDFMPLFDELLRDNPDTAESCFVALYKAQALMRTRTRESRDKAINFLAEFIRQYKGPSAYIASLHILLANQKIIQNDDYASAAVHYQAAIDAGIANPRTQITARFRLARIYDARLDDREKAKKAYEDYLKHHPNSTNAVLVQGYLARILAREAANV